MDDTLANRMKAHPRASEFETHVKALESIDDEMPIPRVLAIWASARRAWCDVTGEPLV